MSISINPLTYVIYVPKADLTLIQSSPEIRELDVNLFRLWLKDWEDDEEGIIHPKTHNHNTEVPLAGLVYARTVEILSPYTIEFEDGQYTINCTGANHNISDVKIPNQVSLIVNNAAGLINNAAIEYSSFNGRVTLDENSSFSGTTFPVGTPQQPVNNLSDAMLVAAIRGLTTIFFIGNNLIDSGDDYTGMTFIGESIDKSILTIHPNAIVDSCEFYEATIEGTLDGNALVQNCRILDLEYINGVVKECLLGPGTIVLGGGANAYFLDCWSGDAAGIPTIDIGGSGQDLSLQRYSGDIKIINKTDNDALVVNLDAGYVLLDSTVTHGPVVLRGSGSYDNEGPLIVGVDIDDEALINKTQISTAVWDESILSHTTANTTGYETLINSYDGYIHVHEGGGSGEVYPWGTKTNPVGDVADALILGALYNINKFCVSGAIVLNGEDVSDITFIADRSLGNSVTVTSMVNTTATYFTDLTVSGALTGQVRFTTCVLGALTGFAGGAKDCLITNKIEIVGAGANYFTNCDTYTTDTTYKEIDIGSNLLNIIRCRGSYEITNYTGTTAITIDLVAGMLKVADTCVSGIITVAGLSNLTDESGPGCYVVDATVTRSGIVDDVWDELVDDHLVAGTTGQKLSTGGSGDPDTIAAAVWDAISINYGTPGTMGWLQNLIDSGIISRPKILPGE